MSSAHEPEKKSENSTMQSMDRGMHMLELLAEQPMRAKELAEATGAKWATAHRTLTYLRDKGFVRRDDTTGLHYVGRRMFAIGSAYLGDHPLFTTSEPLMRTAADRINGFVQIAERDGHSSVAIASVEPRIPVPTLSYANTYRAYPLHTGARGLVLLAYCPDEFIDSYVQGPLRSFTEYTITDPAELRAKLKQIVADGYASSDRDVTAATCGIAAPIRNAAGEVTASVSIANYREQMPPRDLVLHEVLGLAQSLSQLMGWRNR
ncbi:IclR family transcriptional regulator [Rhodococcus sp. IEGM 1307]|uniref:IclR family transcriptional regulator n=1 Tax=Rhodococcus sp. IEGM 1307 TaxID=3047091 RepID=UPI0024B76FAE|nr:IclR family transcriptional regulator [Rhodococcus sp. IEGM 1307]MDI9972193.1 IclR family transcriptional regulator [Rhodococcus sp. IEGM 1307]